jgi:hypothetical protein
MACSESVAVRDGKVIDYGRQGNCGGSPTANYLRSAVIARS